MTRVGVVGTGYLGRLHARVLSEMPEAELIGFVDPDDRTAGEVSQALGIRRFPSLSALAAEIECAIVATPTSAHVSTAAELLEAGRDVLIEKPITSTVEDAERLIELARARQRLIQVGHVERYNPAIQAVAGHLGDVRYVEAERLGVFAGRSLDIDVLFDLMIHDLNLVLSLLARRVTEIRAVGVAVLTAMIDIANVRLEMENGAVANLTASRVSQERVRKVRFFSSESYISVDTKEQDVKGYRLITKGTDRVIQPIEIPVEKQEPLRAELEAFLRCVRERTPPVVSGEDGRDAVALATRVASALGESMRRFQR